MDNTSNMDTYRHKGMRARMVADLRKKGITDERVLEAMNSVPRHLFLDTTLDLLAYEDQALPILCDQTISMPSTVASQSQLLNVQPGMKVLEIGTGSGYQTAILCSLGARVFTIERQKGLFSRTKTRLEKLSYRAKCFLGDGYQGLTEIHEHPFDRIIITCGAPMIPQPLLDQLKEGGIMVIPVGNKEQEMLRVMKVDGKAQIEKFGQCRFVPMLEGRQF